LEISFGVFSSSRSIIISDMHLRIIAVCPDGETDEGKERKERKGSNCFGVSLDGETNERKERKEGNCFEDDNEDGFKALKTSTKHSVHPEPLNCDFIKLKCSSLEFFHDLIIRRNLEQ
jgi:hypothetical protein